VVVDVDRPVYSAYDIVFHFAATPTVALRYHEPPETSMLKPRLELGRVHDAPVLVPEPPSALRSTVHAVATALPGGDAALSGVRNVRRRARRARTGAERASRPTTA
jgi:hypothetical protein